MEIILAIVVAVAVIFFGALISLGNERQRRAIDSLREQVVLWAVQDLKIKHEHLARNVQVPNPLDWLNNIVSKVFGYDLKLQIIESFDGPQALICTSSRGNLKVAFSPLSPADLSRIKNGKHNRLSQFAGQNPLLCLPRKVNIYELSVLNGGAMFDLELSLVWKELTGQSLVSSSRLWMYENL